ncbi:N-6 DNA methylase [Pelagicoccus sp. SDUM812002]|uniref:type I restriction-modification system subunit M n=1 Tax=Pelagicoccus sp. SDUM812002 TaxID=3041266 RepID=UPI002810659F|nr:N-6 DNA methylase [Pelagicoccus sp. SDUM812002]MDQ8187675.1 N-6 DNA methylase [Pelagicoccus sp. SDUM812002]
MLLNQTILALIQKLWDRFWSGGISNPLAAIEQITYLLFIKRLDELDLKRQQDADFTGEPYTSRFEGSFFLPHDTNKMNPIAKETLRWSHIKQMTKADEALAHVQTNVFPFLKQLSDEDTPFARHIANAVFLIQKPDLLITAINIIDEIYAEIERDQAEGGHTFQDIQGDVYEMLLNEISSAGKNGQFRTPRHIIKLVTELVGPQLGHRVCDPACGTAGFLLDAYQYIVTQLARKKAKKGQTFQPDDDGFIRTSISGALTEKNKKILEQTLQGYDFDGTMVRLGLMNLMMHGLDNPQIDYQDTLSKRFEEEGQYNAIMANPPFTGSIDKGDINESLKLNTTKTELLFLERIFTLLTVGGTAGVILPQGVLFGSGKAFVEIRKKLVEEAELKAVISLPSGVFKPYAGVSTAILIFTRGGTTENTWFYRVDNDGKTLDDKRDRKEGSDLPDVIQKWNTRDPQITSDYKAKHFFVSVDDLREKAYDLSFNRYSKVEHEETTHEKPKVLLNKLKTLENKIQQGIEELDGILQ